MLNKILTTILFFFFFFFMIDNIINMVSIIQIANIVFALHLSTFGGESANIQFYFYLNSFLHSIIKQNSFVKSCLLELCIIESETQFKVYECHRLIITWGIITKPTFFSKSFSTDTQTDRLVEVPLVLKMKKNNIAML